jgi:hypothetical protein
MPLKFMQITIVRKDGTTFDLEVRDNHAVSSDWLRELVKTVCTVCQDKK